MDVGIPWNKKTSEEQKGDFIKILRTVSGLASGKNKIAALTETGQEGLTNKEWFTQVILNPLKDNSDIKLAYLLLWRNANVKHHYAPYVGHQAAQDFINFFNDPYTLFEADLQNIYRNGKPLIK
jgi:mannan endo-1,4-beta-mannosidase